MKVAFIGLGIMGSRMAAQILKNGLELSVYNRSPEKTEGLVKQGARFAATPAEAAKDAEVVCTCVADPAAMEEVCFGENGVFETLKAGSILVDFSTLSPSASASLEKACNKLDIQYVEAPVTGSKNGAEQGTLLVMAGGSSENLARLAPVLDAVSSKVIHVGKVGDASLVKLAGNLMIGHMMQALSEASAMVGKGGVPLSKLLEVVQASGYASPYWAFKGQALQDRDFEAHFPLSLMEKDLRLALETGTGHGVAMPGTTAVREVYLQAIQQGLGALDFAATAALSNPDLLNQPEHSAPQAAEPSALAKSK